MRIVVLRTTNLREEAIGLHQWHTAHLFVLRELNKPVDTLKQIRLTNFTALPNPAFSYHIQVLDRFSLAAGENSVKKFPDCLFEEHLSAIARLPRLLVRTGNLLAN